MTICWSLSDNLDCPCYFPRMLLQRDISAVYARLLAQSGLLPVDHLLRGSGVTAEQLAEAEFLSWQAMARLLQNILDSQEDPAWAARLGAQIGISAHGTLGFAALSAPTLGAALEVITDYLPVRVSAVGIELERKDQRYRLRLFDRNDTAGIFNSSCEIVLKTLETLVMTLLGAARRDEVAAQARIHLARPCPADPASLHEVFVARLEFAAGENAMSLPASWWQLPSPLHDEVNYCANLAKCAQLLGDRQRQVSCALTVETLLRQHFDEQSAGQVASRPPPTLRQVAALLHVSGRTLIRRLQAEQQTYKLILRGLRRDYARTLLGNAGLTVAEISGILGYREPANFGRAFRSWYGTSPADWRRNRV